MKLPHKTVNYRASTDDRERCAVCSMYVKGTPPSCTHVVQPIRPFDVCDDFDPKGGH